MSYHRRIQRRPVPPASDGRQPGETGSDNQALLERLFRIRGIAGPDQMDHSLAGLIPPNQLKHIDAAATLVADALTQGDRIVIVGDFDADGATGTALLVSALRAMGASAVDYLVPDRFRFGYGLTPEIVLLAARLEPRLLVTVDNGISSIEGVAEANRLGIRVLVTDHHLPGEHLPAAAAILNPNQPGCPFPSKCIAGVGVAFYLMSAVRARLREQGYFQARSEPNLADWLDLVALGTVADVVPLDQNNRRLVHEGVRRIRAGRCRAGLRTLCEVAGIELRHLTTRDLAFGVAPRLNAAGRLDDMSIGIECLLATEDEAQLLAERLDSLNRERREIEVTMRDEAMQYMDAISLEDRETGGICLYSKDWHQGIVGIVASRVREKTHRPVIAFAPASVDELKGSGRSIQGFHLRDALDTIAARYPGLITRFGGHAMAAGLSLQPDNLDRFRAAFDQLAAETLGEAQLEQLVETDGELGVAPGLDIARLIESAAPWGQGFPEPEFDDRFEVLEQRIVGGRHLKLLLLPATGEPVEAICFNHHGLVESRYVHCAYRIEVNRFRGREQVQLVVSVIL